MYKLLIAGLTLMLAMPASAAQLVISASTTLTDVQIFCDPGDEPCDGYLDLGAPRDFALSGELEDTGTPGLFGFETMDGWVGTVAFSGNRFAEFDLVNLAIGDGCGATTFAGSGRRAIYFESVCLTQSSAAYGTFTGIVTSVTLDGAAVGVVPESAAWMLLILGFGAVGGAMRVSRFVSRPRPAIG